MNRYGQTTTWSTLSAPHPFTGILQSYSYHDATQRYLDDDEGGDNRALVEHSAKAQLSFEAKVTDQSTDFLDLSAGGAVVIEGISAGLVLATRAVETWALGQPKKISLQATHFPDITASSDGQAGTLAVNTPAQSSLTIVKPGGKIIYGTFGLSHSAGIVHGLTIEQQLSIAEDEPSPEGKIVGAVTHGYLRTIRLSLLSNSTVPVKGNTLSITGAPTHASNYIIESVETRFTKGKNKMYEVGAVWIPALG